MTRSDKYRWKNWLWSQKRGDQELCQCELQAESCFAVVFDQHFANIAKVLRKSVIKTHLVMITCTWWPSCTGSSILLPDCAESCLELETKKKKHLNLAQQSLTDLWRHTPRASPHMTRRSRRHCFEFYTHSMLSSFHKQHQGCGIAQRHMKTELSDIQVKGFSTRTKPKINDLVI